MAKPRLDAYRHKVVVCLDENDPNKDMASPLLTTKQIDMVSTAVSYYVGTHADLDEKQVRSWMSIRSRCQSAVSRMRIARRHQQAIESPKQQTPGDADVAVWLVRALLSKVDDAYIRRQFRDMTTERSQRIRQVIEDIYLGAVISPSEPSRLFITEREEDDDAGNDA